MQHHHFYISLSRAWSVANVFGGSLCVTSRPPWAGWMCGLSLYRYIWKHQAIMPIPIQQTSNKMQPYRQSGNGTYYSSSIRSNLCLLCRQYKRAANKKKNKHQQQQQQLNVNMRFSMWPLNMIKTRSARNQSRANCIHCYSFFYLFNWMHFRMYPISCLFTRI